VVAVGDRLLAVGYDLIDRGLNGIAVRCRLVETRGRLVGVRSRLVGVRGRLVGARVDRIALGRLAGYHGCGGPVPRLALFIQPATRARWLGALSVRLGSAPSRCVFSALPLVPWAPLRMPRRPVSWPQASKGLWACCFDARNSAGRTNEPSPALAVSGATARA